MAGPFRSVHKLYDSAIVNANGLAVIDTVCDDFLMDENAVKLISFAIIAVAIAAVFLWVRHFFASKRAVTDEVVSDPESDSPLVRDEQEFSPTKTDAGPGVLFAIELILFQTMLILTIPWIVASVSNSFGAQTHQALAILAGLVTFLIVGIVYARSAQSAERI